VNSERGMHVCAYVCVYIECSIVNAHADVRMYAPMRVFVNAHVAFSE
jgi:hypothetical protein